MVHVFVDRETTLKIDTTGNSTPDTDYKQRRLLNWLMLNIANSVMEINWSDYEEEELEILERHLSQWRDIGFLPSTQWHGATAEFEIYFLNKRYWAIKNLRIKRLLLILLLLDIILR